MEKINKMSWWRESRFGMFIHWGIYSLKAKGEWVMYNDRIPVDEYEKLAEQFNPDQFSAEEWVKLAKDTGMKYIVITAKHHDGFSMFKTGVSSFNIVDGTPFGRDVMAELAQVCMKHDVRLCFYYSHVREWRHPHAQSLETHSPDLFGNYGNFWDYPDECKKNLQTYIDEFDKPQLKELLNQYGPIGVIWFDTPSLIRPDQAQELIELVRSLQPDCLVNSRVGDCVDADYYSLGDCEVPDFNTGADFETPMTICDAWGYNDMPGNQYRDVQELIRQLVDIVSLGGNYLLNVGPDARGMIPVQAQDKLRGVGRWMQTNGEAIYGTQASPFPAKPSWGRITAKGDALYLFIYDWNETIAITGLKSRATGITLLGDPGRKIAWTQNPCGKMGYDRLVINLSGEVPDPYTNVLKVQFDRMQAVIGIIEDDSGCITLPACLAVIRSSGGQPQAKVLITGVVKDWLSTKDRFDWDFLCEHPGEFEVSVTISSGYHGVWDFGHQAIIECDGQRLQFRIEDSGIPTDHFQKRIILAGSIRICAEGLHRLSMRALTILCKKGQGLQLSSVRLQPRQQ